MKNIEDIFANTNKRFGKVVDFDASADALLHIDFTKNNVSLCKEQLDDTSLFSTWIDEKLATAKANYGIGGYNEHRTIYSRSEHFTAVGEARRLHLGLDIWGRVGTPIYNFYNAKVHSVGSNNNFGDYGATIILEYNIDNFIFHALYGHLTTASLVGLKVGKIIPKGKNFGAFGNENENGSWPPHLHFQLILNMGDYFGDYPGVCKFSEREKYLRNCPNPEVILRHTFGKISDVYYS